MRKKEKIYSYMLFSGMLSSIVYILHVVIGGLLSDGYSHIIQPISDLTSVDAANRGLLIVFTSVYGILAIVFAYSLVYLLKSQRNRLLKLSLMLFLIMEVVSFGGYLLFPLETAGMGDISFQGIMHILVTIIVVISTISFTFLLGFSLFRSEDLRKLGIFIIVCGIVITISGASTGIIMANNIPIAGMIERVNIFTLQLMVFIISFICFRRYTERGSLNFE